jgi:YidC/Oxa1 family membrane protein insertase
MNPITLLFKELVTRPIVNILILFLALTAGNLGLSIIFLTLVIRIILYSTTASANTMSKHMTDIGPKMQELQEKHKDDPNKLAKETMNLLKTEWGGPLKGCLGLLIQIPVFIALLNVIQKLADGNEALTSHIYAFLPTEWVSYLNVDAIQHMFLGIDLLQPGNIAITVLAALMLFAQTTMTTWVQPKPVPQKLPTGQEMPDMSKMMPMMNVMMVFMMGSFVYSVKSWVWLYIMTSTFFGLLQFVRQYRQVLPIKLRALFAGKRKDGWEIVSM